LKIELSSDAEPQVAWNRNLLAKYNSFRPYCIFNKPTGHTGRKINFWLYWLALIPLIIGIFILLH